MMLQSQRNDIISTLELHLSDIIETDTKNNADND